MIKNRVATLSVLSGFVIVGGILFTILTAVVFTMINATQPELESGQYRFTVDYFPFWIFGILYIIPGILGIVAACVQKKCMYIVTLIFDILFLIAMFIIMFILGMGYYGKISGCRSLYYVNDYLCEELQREPLDIFIAIFVFDVITWIVLFIVFILHCYYTCCGENTTTPGLVMQSEPQTNISVSQVSQQQNSQLNPNPVNTVPAYGGPQYGPYWYGAPQYGQNVYGVPLYGPYWYGAPYGQTGYSAPTGQNVYSIPPYGQNGTAAPSGQNGTAAPSEPNGTATPSEHNVCVALPAGLNSYDAPEWQKAHSGHQQNNTATDTASAAEVHALQDITKTNN